MMIHFSFSTVYMTAISCTIMIVLLMLYFYIAKLMVNTGYRLLTFVAYLCVLRLLVSVEFPFSTNVFFSSDISYIVSQIQHPFISIGRFDISIWSIAAGIWLIGIVVITLIYIQSEINRYYAIFRNGTDTTAKYQSSIDKINLSYAKNKNCKSFRVIAVDDIASPMVYGLSTPVILVPRGIVDMNFPREEFDYILSHEISHYYHHDLITKRALSILCLIYWWNPFCKILSNRFDIAMEMRVDRMITQSDAASISTYTRCLIKLYQYAIDFKAAKRKKFPSSMSLIETKEQLVKRFEMMQASTEKPPKTAKIWSIGLIVAIMLTFISSYLFTFEASYISPEIAESTIELTDENTYAVERTDGYYDVYYEGLLVDTTENLDYYSSDMPIYTEDEAPVSRDEIAAPAEQAPGN